MTRQPNNDYVIGQAYEWFVCTKRWWTMAPPEFDQSKGDTVCGTEIKFDQLLHETGNLFFEIKQKPIRLSQNVRAGDWKICGCFTQCRRYWIGDCSRALLFDADRLRQYFRESVFGRLEPKCRPTVKGYAIPFDTMASLATQVIAWPYSWDHCIKGLRQ